MLCNLNVQVLYWHTTRISFLVVVFAWKCATMNWLAHMFPSIFLYTYRNSHLPTRKIIFVSANKAIHQPASTVRREISILPPNFRLSLWKGSCFVVYIHFMHICIYNKWLTGFVRPMSSSFVLQFQCCVFYIRIYRKGLM